MTFKVMSARSAKEYCKENHDKSSIIISINNTFEAQNKLQRNDYNNVRAILPLYFDDIEYTKDLHWIDESKRLITDYRNQGAYQIITKEDAGKVYTFVKNWVEKVDMIIVHCSAGVSRSAGCCAAIMKALTGNDDAIFDSPRYHPNMTVYKEVLYAFMEHQEEN